MSNESDNSERLGRILAAVADSGAELPDSEVVAEAKEAGIDPKQTLVKVQDMLSLSLQRAKKAELVRAKSIYAKSVKSIVDANVRIPETAAERQSLLDSILQRRPDISPLLITMQHRELESFSDEDVINCLRYLIHLGALDEEDEQKE